MLPSKIRKNLELYLMQDNWFVEQNIKALAAEELANKYKKAGKPISFSERELAFYIIENKVQLKKKCEVLAKDIAEKIIPESSWCYLLKNIGTWSIFLLPALYVIPTRLLEEIKKASLDDWNYDMLFAGGFSFISLVIFFIGAIFVILKR